MALTEQHISELIAILKRLSLLFFSLVPGMIMWAYWHPESATRVAEKFIDTLASVIEKFIDIPQKIVKLLDRIVDLIEKRKEDN